MGELRLHIIQHEPFEGPGLIMEWAVIRGHSVKITKVYSGDALPEVHVFDWLVLMGGSMSVHDVALYPWLQPEKELVKSAITAGKIVTGICLGSQLIADVLGGKVYRHAWREIGWFPIHLTEAGKNSDWFSEGWDNQLFFHWHGETFDLPPSAIHLAFSEGCKHQAFSVGNGVFGWQFHPEATLQTVHQMLQSGSEDLMADRFVMTDEQIRAVTVKNLIETRRLYFDLLYRIEVKNATKA